MDAGQIMGIIAEEPSGFWGIRGLCPDERYAVGGGVRQSYEWDRENDVSAYRTTGLTMGEAWRDGYKAGICTVGIEDPEDIGSVLRALDIAARYGDGRYALLHAMDAEHGDDEGELILFGDCFDPIEVVALWRAGPLGVGSEMPPGRRRIEDDRRIPHNRAR